MTRVPILPPAGLQTDSTGYEAPGVWLSGSNVRFFNGRPQSIGGYTALQSAGETYSSTRKLRTVKHSAGNIWIIIAGSATLYAVNTGGSRTDIKPAAGWSSVIRASIDAFGDNLLVSPQGGTLYENTNMSAGAPGACTAVAAAPAQINTMLVTNSRQVMALGCNQEVGGVYNPRCIRWCDIGNYNNWTTSATNNVGEYILPGMEDIVGGGKLGDYIAIWTTGSLWLARFVGDPSQTFTFTRVGGPGLISQDAWCEYAGIVYWWAPDLGFFMYAPGGAPTEIPCPVSTVADDINLSDSIGRKAVLAVANRRFGEIWFCYPTSVGGTPNDKYVVYCISESANEGRPIWYTGTLNIEAAEDSPLLVGQNLTQMLDSTFLTIAGSGTGQALRTNDQQTLSSGATWPAANIESSFYYLNDGQQRVMIKRYVNDMTSGAIDVGSLTLTVTQRNDPNASSASKSITITGGQASRRLDFRYSGRLFSVKWVSSGGINLFFRLGKPAFEVAALGER